MRQTLIDLLFRFSSFFYYSLERRKEASIDDDLFWKRDSFKVKVSQKEKVREREENEGEKKGEKKEEEEMMMEGIEVREEGASLNVRMEYFFQ